MTTEKRFYRYPAELQRHIVHPDCKFWTRLHCLCFPTGILCSLFLSLKGLDGREPGFIGVDPSAQDAGGALDPLVGPPPRKFGGKSSGFNGPIFKPGNENNEETYKINMKL